MEAASLFQIHANEEFFFTNYKGGAVDKISKSDKFLLGGIE